MAVLALLPLRHFYGKDEIKKAGVSAARFLLNFQEKVR
jgi:hypothetical protein